MNRSAAIIEKKRKEARWLAIGFCFVLGIVTLDLIVRNIGPWRVVYRSWWDFYVVWEAASIAFTIVVTPLYWRKYIRRREATAYADVLLSADNQKVHVAVLIFLSAVLLIVAGLVAFCIAINQSRPTFAFEWMLLTEAGCLALGVLCLVIAELIIVKATPHAKQKADEEIVKKERLLSAQTDAISRSLVQHELDEWRKKRADYDDIFDDIGKVLAFSDAPIGAAFFVIFLLVLAHSFGWTGAEDRLLPPFIAGAVALQLLYSNFVFYIEANGAFPKWIRALAPGFNEVTPMIQGQRRTQNPQFTNQSLSIEPKPIIKEPSSASKVPNDE